ncbi:RNA polymerase III, large subunit [Trachipleistophora hominis]|uniref:DNA-directed RNA polymerase n=1 Tax=Trachipleistophora hominis TaxID=72359 RepID=L7JZ59_TRAHO|nr:RNA polymerase III, large subunit [Trachipleistophora hominis]
MYPPADKYFVYFRRPMKKIVNELEGLATKIESINFGILTEQRAKELSVLKISKREIYDINTEKPMVGGVLDPKLGLSSPGELCETCNKTLQECAGHFGHIELTLPVFHPGYQKMLVKILQTICKKCSRILLPEKKIFLYRINNKNIFNDDTLFGEAKKNQTCFYCSYTNGAVKKGIGTKILYSGYDLNPVVVRSLLSQIEDYDLLNFNKKGCNELYDNICDTGRVDHSFNDTSLQPHLRNDFNLFTNIVVSTVLVPPACSRPSVKTDEFGSNEDDLTIKLSEMVQLSGTIVNSLTTSSLTLLLNDWELLNNTFNSYISGNNLRSLLTRLKGKQGRFRNNLSGKRSDYTARTVISP